MSIKKTQTQILVLLHHLKNSSFFSVCMEKDGFPKLLSCYITHLCYIRSALQTEEGLALLC